MALFWRRPADAGVPVMPRPEPVMPAQELVDGIPDPAAFLDAHGQITAANREIGLLFSRDRCEGRTLLELSRSAELSEAATRGLRGGHVRLQIRLPSSDTVVQASISPMSGGALVVLRDLTEDKRLESVRRDFIANASHELRTPVSAISGAVETLLGGAVKLEPDARGFVEMIARHAERLARLTRDLLDLSRLESGQYTLETGPLEVGPFCEGVVELVRGRANEKQIVLGYDGPASLRLLADRRALEQVLVNLLDNAVKFTPQGGRVTLLADGAGPFAVLSVIDSGPGIEPRHRERIFERFYRVDTGRSRESGGTGLGLSIVKHLVQAQGGQVGVESGRGGSRFWVRLPVAT
jgi:two-component system, OmpR family, phosphate regulon sensor histidine kinase PhoR